MRAVNAGWAAGLSFADETRQPPRQGGAEGRHSATHPVPSRCVQRNWNPPPLRDPEDGPFKHFDTVHFFQAESLEHDLRGEMARDRLGTVLIFHRLGLPVFPLDRVCFAHDTQPVMDEPHGCFHLAPSFVTAVWLIAYSMNLAHFLIGGRHFVSPLCAEPRQKR